MTPVFLSLSYFGVLEIHIRANEWAPLSRQKWGRHNRKRLGGLLLFEFEPYETIEIKYKFHTSLPYSLERRAGLAGVGFKEPFVEVWGGDAAGERSGDAGTGTATACVTTCYVTSTLRATCYVTTGTWCARTCCFITHFFNFSSETWPLVFSDN